MLQLELYTLDVEEMAKPFLALDLKVHEEKDGWRKLVHPSGFEIMLFDPTQNQNGLSHWNVPNATTGGHGIEIVITTTNIADKRWEIINLGYQCSELRKTPWNTTEFTFKLKEGYLIRIKQ